MQVAKSIFKNSAHVIPMANVLCNDTERRVLRAIRVFWAFGLRATRAPHRRTAPTEASQSTPSMCQRQRNVAAHSMRVTYQNFDFDGQRQSRMLSPICAASRGVDKFRATLRDPQLLWLPESRLRNTHSLLLQFGAPTHSWIFPDIEVWCRCVEPWLWLVPKLAGQISPDLQEDWESTRKDTSVIWQSMTHWTRCVGPRLLLGKYFGRLCHPLP